VSSPNDPGNGNVPRPPLTTGPVTDRTEVPPWQRGPKGRPPPPPRRQEPAAAHATPEVEDRVNRFMSGPSAAPPPAAPPAEPEAAFRTDAIRSELPDLSGPGPRPRPKPPERTPAETPRAPRASRVQVGPRSDGPLRASMQIRRVDPWSVLKVSLVLSVALFFVWMIAVAFLYLVLGGMGVWAKLNSNVGDLLNNTSSSELVSTGTIFGGAALVGLINIVLLTAMATVGAFIYNLTTDLVGGVEVTLADRD
jgi:Transmembrane domain of unknown function (DUF3566)